MRGRRYLAALARIGGRIALWALVLLLLVRGALDLGAGLAPAAEQLVQQRRPPAQLSEREASAFAAAFARAYLTFTPAHPERHVSALEPFASPWLGDHAGLELPADGPGQRVVDAEPARVVRLGQLRLLVTVAAELAPRRARPVYLTVPVGGSETGALAVVDYPSLSPPPRRAALRQPRPRPLDARGRPQIEDLLRRFFPVYLSGDGDALAYFVPAGRTLEALGDRYRFLELGSVEAAGPARPREATVLARIRVLDEHTQATYLLRYRLKLERGERWYVAAVNTA